MFRHPVPTLAVLLGLACLTATTAARAAEMRIEPADTTVTVGETFTLRVVCDAVPDLKALESAYAFPPAGLQLLSMTAGNVLTDAGGAWFEHQVPDVTAPTDTAWIDEAMLDGSAHGPGVIAYIRFHALATRTCALACVLADMRDSFNAPLSPTCSASVVRVTGPVPVQRRTWGRLKLIWR